MAKEKARSQDSNLANFLGHNETQKTRSQSLQSQLEAVAQRFNRDYRRESFNLPAEVEAMPIFQEWVTGALSQRIASPFWELAKPQKNQRCLDLGCGVSFLIYPWSDWNAFFYGQEISVVAQEMLNTRGTQLNSKLFKGVRSDAAHELNYEKNQFDLVIATGFSCYYPLEYWNEVLGAVRRILKPDGFFLFDALDQEQPLAENWAILETYLGAEVFLESLTDWENLIKAAGGKIVKQQPGDLFQLYKVRFA